jgi:MYXO-CTERM domain-containing protein
VNNVRAAALNVAAGKVRIIGNGSFTGTSKVPSLTLAAGTTLDLTDNKLVTASAIGAWNGSNYDGITGLITTGRNGGSWNGTGIITSKTAAASPSTLTTIAVATGAQVKGISGAQTASWGGQTVAAADTLVMYTYTGDADLSGKINADDYFRIDSSYNKNGVVYGYSNGDFNYDGKINGDDYALIDSAFSGQGSAFATASDVGGVSAVPEPAGLALVVVGALLARRRR